MPDKFTQCPVCKEYKKCKRIAKTYVYICEECWKKMSTWEYWKALFQLLEVKIQSPLRLEEDIDKPLWELENSDNYDYRRIKQVGDD
jgi:hypothetical protein